MEKPGSDQRSRTMVYWLGRTLREMRLAKGISARKVAALIPGKSGDTLDPSSVSRFENGEHWPTRPEEILFAYAYLCGVEDVRDLWQRAVADFIAKGGAPTREDLSVAQRSELLALEAAQRARKTA